MSETPEEPAGPRRVIGTPSPAPKAVDVRTEPDRPAFSAEPENSRHAKNAERIVAVLFVIAFFAGVGFIAAYVGLEIGVSTIPGKIREVFHIRLMPRGALSACVTSAGRCPCATAAAS